MNMTLSLISHHLCPYVQRVAIVLAEKQVKFERQYVDLANKPEWFLAISPLGKTPVLLADGHAVFESAVICEYLEDTLEPRLHPGDPLERARHRGWMELGSAILNKIGGLYNAADETAFIDKRNALAAMFVIVESELGQGPYFAGPAFTLVDAAFAPIFRYFDVFDQLTEHRVFENVPKVLAWRGALSERRSVQDAVGPDYETRLAEFIRARHSWLSRRMLIEAGPQLQPMA